jgi:hypothetical protein
MATERCYSSVNAASYIAKASYDLPLPKYSKQAVLKAEVVDGPSHFVVLTGAV